MSDDWDDDATIEHVQSVTARLTASGDWIAVALISRLNSDLRHSRERNGLRFNRLWHWAHAELNEEQKDHYFNIVANGTASAMESPTFTQQFYTMKHRAERAEAKIAALENNAARLRRLLERYVNETPLGHQPHMIELEAREALKVTP